MAARETDPKGHPQPIPWRRAAAFFRPGPWGWSLMGAVAAVAAYAIPRMTTTRCVASNETSAISSLRNIQSCQDQFRAAVALDPDRDGAGDCGGLQELAGAIPLRGTDALLHPPGLSGAFRVTNARGEVSRSGYLFRLWLVGADGTPVGERAGTGFEGLALDPVTSETRWVCHAWPQTYGAPGCARSFAVDWTGTIVATDCARYSGASGPGGDAIYGPGGLRTAVGPVIDGSAASDGNVWKSIR